MPKHTFLICVSALIGTSLLLASCEQGRASQQPEKKIVQAPVLQKRADTVAKPLADEIRFNDISSILGGDRDTNNPLNHLYDSSAWKENEAFINASWKKLEANRLSKLTKWSKTELAEPNTNCKTVFYPFSGPDFLTANAFFPKADQFIMLGLERVGVLPEIQKFSNLDAKDYCGDFKRSLNDIFQRSYFITSYMQRDFQKQKVDGLLPVLCFFIRKTGHQITNIKYLVKNGEDSISEEPYLTKRSPFGVKVTCRKDSLEKTVYYFKYDVSNKQFNDTCVFYKFINNNTKSAVTYVKSASYLLHANFMNNMKKLILTNSKYLLEDDTGIPYADIEKTKNFSLKLYGKYAKPVKDFPYLKMQPGIVKAFETDSANIPALPFHLGYHWQTNADVLIYAKKMK